MKSRTVWMVSVVAVLYLQACGSDTPTSPGPDRSTDFLASESFTYNLDSAGRLVVRLEGINGSILVNGASTGSSLRITGEREVRSNSLEDARAHLEDLHVDIQDAGSEVFVRTRQPDVTEGRNYVVNYRLTLPASIELRITNVNGSLDLSGMTSSVSASLVNGRSEAALAVPPGGSVDLRTINGEIVLHLPRNTSAVFSAQVTNGTITLTNLVLRNEVRTTSSLRGTLAAGDGTVSLQTTNGAIRVDGTSSFQGANAR